MNEKQNDVTAAGGALSSIFKLLFKGIDKILDSAAEYENDMGVLKQVTKLRVLAPDNNEYDLKIKLAPVKDKEGLFYVEIETNYADFNGGDLNKQVIRLDKENIKDFNAKINELLKNNKLRIIKNADEAEGRESKNYDIECYDEDEYDDWMHGGEEPEVITVEISETPSDEKDKVDITIKASDNRKLMFDDHEVTSDDITEIDSNEVTSVIDKIIADSGLVPVEDVDTPDEAEQASIIQSKHLDVSLSYIKASDEVNIDAIYANYDINEAMASLNTAINDDAFIEQLSETPQCIRITDEGDDLDVQFIDEIDISNVDNDISNAIGNLSAMLDAYYVNMDTQQQAVADQLMPLLRSSLSSFKSIDRLDPL